MLTVDDIVPTRVLLTAGIQYSACADNTATVAAAPGQPAVSVQPRAFSISGTAGQTGTSVSDVVSSGTCIALVTVSSCVLSVTRTG